MAEAVDYRLDLQTLEQMFGDADGYAISQDDEEVSIFPDGTQAFVCTNWAGYVRRVLGRRATIMGFFEEDNPGSCIARDFGGHDFALVDGRWIVDAWSVDLGCHDAAVLDLEDACHAGTILRLYGDRSLWKHNVEFEMGIDAEDMDARAAAMHGTSFAPGSAPNIKF